MSQTGRRRLSLTCIVIGALALALALPLAYLDRNVFEPQGFADNAAATLQNEAVRDELAKDLTRAIVSARPQAVSFVPLSWMPMIRPPFRATWSTTVRIRRTTTE